MSSFNSKTENKGQVKETKSGQINQHNKKGKTLGAQNASHGDSGERLKAPPRSKK